MELIIIIIGVLLSTALITLGERKILSISQSRIGPDKVGILGILQPISDGIKLVLKENIIPIKSNKFTFLLAPIISLTIFLSLWYLIPIGYISIYNTEISILLFIALTSMNIYSILLSGWSSNSRYALLGSLRSISQFLSYEIFIGIIIINLLSLTNEYTFYSFIESQIYIKNIFLLLPLCLITIFSVLVETNRPPADLPESESELVAGYLVEFSSLSFAFIYLSEYGFLVLFSYFINILFFGILNLSFILLLYLFILIRASYPRLKTNILLYLGWTFLLPFSLSFLLFLLSFLFLL